MVILDTLGLQKELKMYLIDKTQPNMTEESNISYLATLDVFNNNKNTFLVKIYIKINKINKNSC